MTLGIIYCMISFMKRKQIKAIIFDVDETLVVERVSEKTTFLSAFKQVAEEYNLSSEDLHNSLIEIGYRLWQESPHYPFVKEIGVGFREAFWGDFSGPGKELARLAEWIPEYRKQVWQRLLREYGVDDPLALTHLDRQSALEREKYHVPFPEAEEVLKELRTAGYPLGVLSNGAPRVQRRKLEGAGLLCYFEEVLVSGDMGVGKPGKEPFLEIAKRFHCPPEELVMVGDNLEKDIKGAVAVGMPGILVERDAEDAVSHSDSSPASAIVRDLRQLLVILSSW